MATKLKNTRILVLGGFGFLGQNLQIAFSNTPYSVFYESRRTGCDITDLRSLIRTVTVVKPDVIVNAAAHVGSISYVSKYAGDVVRDNSLMYINLFEAIKQTDPTIKVINPISNCSYPGIVDVQHEDEWWNGPIHPSVESYGTPKKLGFIISECYKKQYGVQTVNLIVPNAYGPYDYLDQQRTHAMNGIIVRMIEAKINGDKEFVIWGTGTPIREWIYMPDVARLIVEVISKDLYDKLPNPLNIGQEYGVSINTTATNVKTYLEYDGNFVYDLTKQDGAPIKVLGSKLFKKHFPDFKFTPYEVGIKETVEYIVRLNRLLGT